MKERAEEQEGRELDEARCKIKREHLNRFSRLLSTQFNESVSLGERHEIERERLEARREREFGKLLEHKLEFEKELNRQYNHRMSNSRIKSASDVDRWARNNTFIAITKR